MVLALKIFLVLILVSLPFGFTTSSFAVIANTTRLYTRAVSLVSIWVLYLWRSNLHRFHLDNLTLMIVNTIIVLLSSDYLTPSFALSRWAFPVGVLFLRIVLRVCGF